MYDLGIIGGGPGGYTAAIRAAQHGLKVLLVEKDSLGGTCLNSGCIPTKSLVYDSKLLYAAQNSPVLKGAENLTIDSARMLARKRQVVKTLLGGLQSLMSSHRIDVVQGRGSLAAPGRLCVHRTDGTKEQFQARHVILANGSQPAVPPFIHIDGKYIQTTNEALDCEEIPRNLVIIGGGVIGLEMATIFLNLGVSVTIIELLPDILVTEDKEVRQAMQRILRQRGARIFMQAKTRGIAVKGDLVEVTFEENNGTTNTLTCDRVIVATGRKPVLDGIPVEQLGIQMKGPFVKVNSQMKTNLPNVYAIGDIVGGMMLAHKASAEAETAVDNILGVKKPLRYDMIPRCIWGLTEIGAVGLSEEEAIATQRKIQIGKFSFNASGAAQAMGHVDGFVKIIGDAENGEILGAHILGAHATDLVGEIVTAMTMESSVEDLAETIKPHPTLSEAIMEAALDWSGLAIHKMRPRQ